MLAIPTPDLARQQVAGLVRKYQALGPRDRQRYREAEVCKDFILPLFAALGWDVADSREVAAEEKASHGRVDYAFRLRGVPRFFLEAKPFRVDLEEARWADQAITYAYNRGVAWAVLTDFEGLKVFNADRKTADILGARFLDLTADQYLPQFDKLWLLSKPSIAAGRLDAEAAAWGAGQRREPVGDRLKGLICAASRR